MAAPWFDEHLWTWLGVIVGGGGGSLGGLLGAVVGALAPRGIGRPWVIGSMLAFAGVGVALLIFGLVALLAGQPFTIWYWPVVAGGLFAVLFGVLTPVIRRRYDQAEARRLDAEALRRS